MFTSAFIALFGILMTVVFVSDKSEFDEEEQAPLIVKKDPEDDDQ